MEVHTGIEGLQGKMIYPDHDDYDSYRSVWNKAAKRRPHAIIVPVCERDVSLAVQYALTISKPICVRGGGHHFAGLAVQDDAVMIHMGLMNHIDINLEKNVVRVGAGATIGELDRATQEYGLAVPTGTSSGTGIAGLTLGGGLGHLRRQYGLACDQLVGARIVLATGEIITVNDSDYPDILWGLRGGGGNFGIVTDFEFRLHPVGPEVAVLDVFYPLSEFQTVMGQLMALPHTAPDELSFHLLISPLPVNPIYPRSLQGQWVIRVLGMVNDNPESGMQMLAHLRQLATPLFDRSGVIRYPELQSRLDANFPTGVYYDGTSLFLEKLTPEVVDRIQTILSEPQPVSFQLWMLGGKLSRTLSHQTAYYPRNADWVIFINAAASDMDKLAIRASWMRQACDMIGQSELTRTMYMNAIGRHEIELDDTSTKIFGGNHARLRELKQRIDPDNLFRYNVTP